MDKESIKEIIKLETELLKIYSVFVITISTGIVGLLLRWNFDTNPVELWLLILGLIFLLIFAAGFINSFLKIIKWSNKILKL